MITQERLKELFYYNKHTGDFTRKLTRGCSITGSIAGTISDNGYTIININNKNYRAHRLAWLYMNGNLPEGQIDHINRNKTDNRLSNLREATHQENQRNKSLPKNNTSGVRGVGWDNRSNRWRVTIKANGKLEHLGYFKSREEAVKIREDAEKQYGYHMH